MKSLTTLRLPSLFLFTALTTSALAEQAHWKKADYISDSFIEITLDREHGGHHGKLSKWLSPIRYLIDDRTADEALHQRMVSQHLHHLSAITGLDIKPSTHPQKTNLRIIFGSEKDLDQALLQDLGLNNKQFRQQIIHDSVCVARVMASPQGEIKAASVLIPVDRARAHGKLMSCVVEELTQVLGLVNDSSRVYPSIFNDRSFNDFLSGLDYVLLKLLYEPAIKAGMDQVSLRQQLKLILSRPAFVSLIDSAEQAVQQDSLENWLN
ncbi:DUF2927 domain-containing protein [Methylophaga sp.]|jgi:hypothetical protein|uniref:DUF2927 domain-containing protein n=1 Tax=Methylophaga sp. TaxID=2024840 RepID=UPI001400432F|nr:DUF2927 domain-containing protein [Methylophaga sp.]MTI64131.1 DUF2927 domain-containing protein [Methylophaga sp.]